MHRFLPFPLVLGVIDDVVAVQRNVVRGLLPSPCSRPFSLVRSPGCSISFFLSFVLRFPSSNPSSSFIVNATGVSSAHDLRRFPFLFMAGRLGMSRRACVCVGVNALRALAHTIPLCSLSLLLRPFRLYPRSSDPHPFVYAISKPQAHCEHSAFSFPLAPVSPFRVVPPFRFISLRLSWLLRFSFLRLFVCSFSLSLLRFSVRRCSSSRPCSLVAPRSRFFSASLPSRSCVLSRLCRFVMVVGFGYVSLFFRFFVFPFLHIFISPFLRISTSVSRAPGGTGTEQGRGRGSPNTLNLNVKRNSVEALTVVGGRGGSWGTWGDCALCDDAKMWCGSAGMGMACGVDHDRGRGDVAYSPIHFSSALHLLSSTTPSISFPSFRFVAVLLHFLSFLVISFPSRDASRAWVAAVPFIDRAPSFSPSLSRLFASRFTSLSAHSRSN